MVGQGGQCPTLGIPESAMSDTRPTNLSAQLPTFRVMAKRESTTKVPFPVSGAHAQGNFRQASLGEEASFSR